MKKSRFTEEQIIGILREHQAGAKKADLCRKRDLDLSRFRAAPGSRLGDVSFEGDGAFPAES